MFSYLRPHHRRTPSNPTSPAEQSHSFVTPLHSSQAHAHPPRYQDAPLPEFPANVSPPPSLPPVARVVSPEEGAFGRVSSRPQQWDPTKRDTRQKDNYAFGNHLRIPATEETRPESAGNMSSGTRAFSNPLGSRPPTSGKAEPPRQQRFDGGHGYVPPADTQRGQGGRKGNGVRVPSPPPSNVRSTFEEAPVQPRSGKGGRLNLLNPMSLLARRRTAQAVTQLSPEAIISSRSGGNKFSENYDPRIRGTVVHDFSAPRGPRRNVSYNDVGQADNGSGSARTFHRSPNPDGYGTDETSASPWSGGNHTPVFTENFEEEQYPAAGPHVRKASDLTDLSLPKPPYAKESQKVPDQNARSRSQVPAEQGVAARKPSDRNHAPDRPPPVPPKEEAPHEPRRAAIDPGSAVPQPVPKSVQSMSKKGRARGVSEVSLSARDGLPKHMKSTSSRFSFDMIGAAEQERLLEDRHRKKALEKKAEAEEDERLEDNFENDFDYDDMMDDDGLEERIPGVNADLEDEEDPYEEPIPGVNMELEEEEEPYEEEPYEEPIPGVDADIEETTSVEPPRIQIPLGGFRFHSSYANSPLSPTSPDTTSTPRDENGHVIGFAMTKNSPGLPPNVGNTTSTPPISPEYKNAPSLPEIQGLGIDMQDFFVPEEKPTSQPDTNPREFPRPAALDCDDLYFDDGIIGGLGDSDEAAEFDESVFDNDDTDGYGRPLRALSALPTLYSPPMLTADPSPSFNKLVESSTATNDSSNHLSPTYAPQLAPQPSISENLNPYTQPTGGLTQDTLAAYQSALAAAAFAAAANGKFRRDSAISTRASEQEDTHPSLIPDSSHTSQNYEPFSPSYELEDDFDYDDALEDDAIIAAANAEALANDCDGFYGQEFGFYSAPSATEATYANGGYFGPRGVEGLNRARSGRDAAREPNLTPITERSEYSNRNSFMSLNMHPPGSGSVASPGLAQLAGMMRSPDFDGDMSLDALLKLRRGAWGGSQASLHSGTGSPRSASAMEESSPASQPPPWKGPVHCRKNSGFSLSEVNSEYEDSAPGSPTVNMNFNLSPLESSGSHGDSNGNSKENLRPKARHRYTGSAESISYEKEVDPVGGERWILERRRTAENGELEVLGREVVSGGRI